ncbi:hypothetical protein AVEN_12788-1 [Araneus ventricosus]|uniref:Uncharacterized protein n=1 Tax=Araneus ventricosus TaxID=182803 RepID=A0A4Y2AB94_ARAVE|nr:hypothetical protein AVEN_12788-1 [Araneus ventricosus]
MRSCRISKQVLASPDGTIMVVWLLGPTSDDSSYPGKKGGLLHEPLVMGAIMQEPQCLTICCGGWSFKVNPDAKAKWGDPLCLHLRTNRIYLRLPACRQEFLN